MSTINDIEKMMKGASFSISAAKFTQCPIDQGKEIAFAGRSNAGKSSAINTLCQQTQLAHSSKTPGRTQLINFFSLTKSSSDPDLPNLKLVDLPGYGYAKVSEQIKQSWQKELRLYLEQRESLVGIILMMDIRHPLRPFDEQLLKWSIDQKMPIHVLLTKSDKVSNGAAKNTLYNIADKLTDMNGLFSVQLFSSLKKKGVQDAYQMIGEFFGLLDES